MRKEDIDIIEDKLRAFYQGKTLIDGLNSKIKNIQNQIEDIDNKIKNTKVTIKPEDIKINYTERVQESKSTSSYVEKELVKEIDYLENVKNIKINLKNKLEIRRNDIDTDNQCISMLINEFNEEYKEILLYKYKEGKPDWLIGQKIHKSRAAVGRIRSKLINDIYNWLRWLN